MTFIYQGPFYINFRKRSGGQSLPEAEAFLDKFCIMWKDKGPLKLF